MGKYSRHIFNEVSYEPKFDENNLKFLKYTYNSFNVLLFQIIFLLEVFIPLTLFIVILCIRRTQVAYPINEGKIR
jgi:hypothetical protein